jgi:hypothetical protein
VSIVVEQVTLRVYLECFSCTRRIDTSETLPGESVRTGNHTQRAAYWLERMKRNILTSASTRRWEHLDKGWRCAHCTAAYVDSLAKKDDPIDLSYRCGGDGSKACLGCPDCKGDRATESLPPKPGGAP